MPYSQATIRNLIIGGITLASVSVLFYFFYWRPTTGNSIKQIKDVESPKDKKNVPKGITIEDVEDSEGESDEEDSSSDEEEEDEKGEEEENEQLEVKKEATSPERETPNPNPVKKVETSDQTLPKEVDVPEKDEATQLKEQYDVAVRLASKLITGQLNERAVEKLTEAIELAPRVPSAQKDILTLYNNRSAMYEKLGLLEQSLSDINMVLTMDAFHLKARVRRARVEEAQDNPLAALQDYVFATILERSKGSDSNYDKKITELSKRVAIQRTPAALRELRSPGNKQKRGGALPSKGYCRNFLEAYPNSYLWKQRFYGVGREDLVSLYQKHLQAFNTAVREGGDVDKLILDDLLGSGVDLVEYDLSHDSYKKAFSTLHDLPYDQITSSSHGSHLSPAIDSTYHELVGTELHLMFQMEEALREYEIAVNLYPANLSAQLKYNSVLLENGERDKALAGYSQLLALLRTSSSSSSSQPNPTANPTSKEGQEEGEEGEGFEKITSEKSSEDGSFADARASPLLTLTLDQETKEMKIAYLAWVLNHQASLWVSRDEYGFYAENALGQAMADLEESLKLSGDVMNLPEGKGAHFIALLKSVQLRTHTKQAMEIQVTEEDYNHNRMAIQSAKNLFPDHESVLLLEVEQLTLEGDMQTAKKMVEKAGKSGNYDEFILVNLKATITTQEAFLALQGNPASVTTQSLAQQHFEEVTRLYARALELDPESLEVKAQFAQLKSMMFGDLDGAMTLLRDALAIARSRDEVQDLLTMLVGNEAQSAAIEEIRKAQQ